MANITTRASKGAPLSWDEADANFTNLNTAKLEVSNNLSDVSNPTAARSNLGLGNVDNTSDINKPISAATQAALNGKQDALPSQTGNNGKFLGTNGTTLSWNTVDALPSQTGNNGKFLTTNGTTASWATLNTDANTTTKGLYENSNTISANYSITSGNNAMSAGPITVANGVVVTVPDGSTWTVV